MWLMKRRRLYSNDIEDVATFKTEDEARNACIKANNPDVQKKRKPYQISDEAHYVYSYKRLSE